MIHEYTKPNRQLLRSASSRPLIKSSPKFLASSTFFLSLIVGSTIILRAYSHLPTYHDPQIYGVFTGRRFLTTGFLARTADEPRDESFYCDRSHLRTDVCVAKGDVRVSGQAGSVVVFSEAGKAGEEKVRPYTRKWEESVMKTIDEVSIMRRVIIGNTSDDRSGQAGVAPPRCDVKHDVPAIVFSTGGYTGNVYHEFNDGLIPLFITAQHLRRGVVLMILEYHDWWMSKYGEIVAQISKHEVLDFTRDKRVHCFPEVTVGLRIHDELAIHPDQNSHGHDISMQDFQTMLRSAYLPRLQGRAELEASGLAPASSLSLSITKPKLVIISRDSPRAILNQMEVVALAEELGFFVHVLAPKPTTEMVDIYWALNTCDVMLGVHGAAMTHLLFMRPGSTFIQVVPLGTDWAAATYYGEPAQKLGLNYVEYKVSPFESSLSDRYAMDDPVLVDPDSVNSKGWWETKRIYLEGQDVKLSLERVRDTLRSSYRRAVVTSSSPSWWTSRALTKRVEDLMHPARVTVAHP